MSKQTRKPTPGAHAGTAARYHMYHVGVAIDLNDTIAAIVLHHIYINIERLEENSKLDSDGIAWLTVSKTGIIRFLCEFSKSQIETAINKLVDNKLLAKKMSNRKNSYTLTDLAWSYYPRLPEEGPVKAPKADAEEADKAAEKESNSKPIDKKVKPLVVSDDVKEVIDYVSKKVSKHYDYANSYVKNINSLFAAGYTKADMIAVVDQRYEDLQGTKEFNVMMNPSKLLFIKTFPNYLKDAKGNDVTMTPDQLAEDSKKKEEYHLKEAERCKCERLILESDPDSLPFLTVKTSPESMIKDRVRKERYHRTEANKFADMHKLLNQLNNN